MQHGTEIHGEIVAIPRLSVPDLIWLDVAPDGEVLAQGPAPEGAGGPAMPPGALLSALPREVLRDALAAANRRDDPEPTVLRPTNAAVRWLRQVNVLPCVPGRIRIVLFLAPCPAETDEAELPHLSPREKAVLTLLAAGRRRDRIAWELNISLPTVDMHSRNLRQKLKAQTLSEAVATAARCGLIQPD